MILGQTPSGENVEFDIFAPAHTLVSGATRSGKSVQIYIMLNQMRVQPIQLCGIDPTGILFNAIGSGLGGDSLRVSTLRYTQKVKSVMENLLNEMDSRIDLLLSKKKDKFDKLDFSVDFPLLVVVLEEYPGILAATAAIDISEGLKGKEKTETFVRAAVQRLALEGAKVGVRLIICAQRADASLLTGVLRSQLVNRFCFRQDPDGFRMLVDGITPEQIESAQKFKPGQAYLDIVGESLKTYRSDLISYETLVRVFQAT